MNRFGDIDYSLTRLPAVYGYRSAKLVSLEESLQAIQSQINDLPFYVKTAKRRCHFPSEHGLTKDESASVYIYTMEWDETSLYRILNKALRNQDRNALKIWFPYLKLLDSALEKLPNVRGIVWRGVSNDIGKNFSKNQKITWWSVNSCSSSINVIKSFLGNETDSTIFLIEASNGKKISGYTDREEEDEVILKFETDLRVQGDVLEHPKGLFHVHLVEINEEEVEENQEAHVASAINKLQIKTKEKQTKFIPLRASSTDIHRNARWKQNGITVAGGNGQGNGINQLSNPWGLYVDDDQNVYVTDRLNHRIVKWKSGAKSGQVIAGGNQQGSGDHQFYSPLDVIIDKERDSLIICDYSNRRVIRWPCQNGTSGEIIISNINCLGLTMDKNGSLYIVDDVKDEVRRYERGECEGRVVAGGNGKGNRLDQLSNPHYIFVDRDRSVYVSDWGNARVMKWIEGAKQGIVVAGGQGQGNGLTQLSSPLGVIVDQLGTVYVADGGNARIMRWSKGATEGSVIVGGNGGGSESNLLSCPLGLSFDRHGNLYVVDWVNHRVQKFNIEFNG